MNRYITAKLGNMRKPQEFIAFVSGKDIILQSDKSIGVFNPETGKGILNIRGCYFPHLHPAMGAIEYTLPVEVLAVAREQCFRHGDAISKGVCTFINYDSLKA